MKKSGWKKDNLDDCQNLKATAVQEGAAMRRRMRQTTSKPQIKHIQEERGGSFVVVVSDDHLIKR